MEKLFEVRDSFGITRGFFPNKRDAKAARDNLLQAFPLVHFRVSRGPDHHRGKSHR